MDKIIKWLKDNLNEEKYIHSLAAAKTAKQLAQQFNEDMNKAELAGLLHDCAKQIPYAKAMEIIKENDLQRKLNITDEELMAKKVIHAPLSTFIAQNRFKIDDEKILNAIRFHTTGKIGMSTFEKIIFLADKLEPETRIEPYFQELRDVFQKTNNLDATLLHCSKMTIQSLVERELPINSTTIDLYNDLLKNLH